MAQLIGTGGGNTKSAVKKSTGFGGGGAGGSFARSAGLVTTPIAAPAPVVQEQTYSGGGGSGGGGYAAPVAAAVPRQSLAAIIDSDFALQQQRQAGDRSLQDFDTDSNRQRGMVERDQGVRRQALQTDLQEQSVGSAEDLAGRGLLRSGGIAVNQDKINRYGTEQENGISDLLTKFISDRGSQRLQQEAANRAAIQDRINSISSSYAQGLM